MKKEQAKAKKKLAWKDDYLDICLKTNHLGTPPSSVPTNNSVKLPLYSEIISLPTSSEVIRVPGHYESIFHDAYIDNNMHSRLSFLIGSYTDHFYKLEMENPGDYYISGIECDSLDSLPLRCRFGLSYNELIVNEVSTEDIKICQKILGLKENQIPFPMLKGKIPFPLHDNISIEIQGHDQPEELNITYLLKQVERLTTPMSLNTNPFIIYQYQGMQRVILDEEKMLEVRFSHYIGYILIRAEPFYDGPMEAVFEYDNKIKRRVLSLPEDKSYRMDNWRVFRLRGMKSSSLNQYPLNFVYVYFLHLETKTTVDISVISANNVIIHDGHLTHPSQIGN